MDQFLLVMVLKDLHQFLVLVQYLLLVVVMVGTVQQELLVVMVDLADQVVEEEKLLVAVRQQTIQDQHSKVILEGLEALQRPHMVAAAVVDLGE